MKTNSRTSTNRPAPAATRKPAPAAMPDPAKVYAQRREAIAACFRPKA